MATAAMRPSVAAPFGPCIPTPVESAAMYAQLFPSASFVQAHGFEAPKTGPSASFFPNCAPTRSAVRCTVDSLTRIPLLSGNAFDAASEKRLIVPARVVSRVAPSDNRLSSNRSAASRGECPAPHGLQ